MPWRNSPLRLYHGTDEASALSIINAPGSISLSKCDPLTDFGRGFYTTTYLHQAKNWANLRAEKLRLGKTPAARAAVLEFDVDLDELAGLEDLVFLNDAGAGDLWDFIRFNRRGLSRPHARRNFLEHKRSGLNRCYDVVFGQVSLWPQSLLLKDCDQISFHTPAALKVLRPLSLKQLAPKGRSKFII